MMADFPFALGDRVQLVGCSGAPGTVVAIARGRAICRFDDTADRLWALRPQSLESANRKP